MTNAELQKFMTSGVYLLYQNKAFLKCPHMKRAIKGVQKGKEVVIADPLEFVTKKSGIIVVVTTIWGRVKLKFKFFINPPSKKKFTNAAQVVDKAFRESCEKKIASLFPDAKKTTSKEEVTPADLKAFEELTARILASKKDQEEIAKEIREKETHVSSLKKALQKLEGSNCEFPSKDAHKEIYEHRKYIIENILRMAREYEAAPWTWFGLGNEKIYDLKPFKEFLSEYKESFDFNCINQEIKRFESKKTDLSKIIQFLDQAAKIQNAEIDLGHLQKKLEAQKVEINRQVIELVNLAKKCQLKFPDSISLSDEEVVQTTLLEEEPKVLIPEFTFHSVMKQVNDSIDRENSSQAAKAFQREAQYSFMEKFIQTPKLLMGGIETKELSQHKFALVMKTLSKALCEEDNNKKLRELIANVIVAITDHDPNVTEEDKNAIREFILYIFGFNNDAKNPQPNLDKGYRYRIILFMFAAGVNLAHYYLDPDCLESSYRKIKLFEGGQMIKQWIIAAAKALFQNKIDNVTNSILEVPFLKDNELKKSQAKTFIKVFTPIGETLLFGADSQKLKAKVREGIKGYANGDLKEFMDLVSYTHPLTTTEMTNACIKLFTNFIENIK